MMHTTFNNFPDRNELAEILEFVAKEASTYLQKLDDLPVRTQKAEPAAKSFISPLPETGAGVERAHSVTVDGHKWLNVPYDCGFAFVKGHHLLAKTFAYSAAYLPGPDDPHPNFGAIGPESSRRARSLAVWATLRAYGRQGYQALIEQHLALAQRMAQRVDEAPDLELADPRAGCRFFCRCGSRIRDENFRRTKGLIHSLFDKSE